MHSPSYFNSAVRALMFKGLYHTAAAPFDRLKCIIETQTEMSRIEKSYATKLLKQKPSRSRRLYPPRASSNRFSSSFHAARSICSREGLVGLWRGNCLQLMYLPFQALSGYCFIGTMASANCWFSSCSSGERRFALVQGLSYLLSGIFFYLIAYPLDFLRFHIAVDTKGTFRRFGTSRVCPAPPRAVPGASSSLLPPVRGAGVRYALPSSTQLSTNFLSRRRSVWLPVAHSHHSSLALRSLLPDLLFLSRSWPRRAQSRLARRYLPVSMESPRHWFTGLGLQLVGSALYLNVFFVWNACASFSRSHHRALDEDNAAVLEAPRLASPWSTPLIAFSLYAFSHFTALVMVHPIDLVRRRTMLAVLDHRLRYRSSTECARLVWVEEGVRGFYRGFPITIGRMAWGFCLLAALSPWQ